MGMDRGPRMQQTAAIKAIKVIFLIFITSFLCHLSSSYGDVLYYAHFLEFSGFWIIVNHQFCLKVTNKPIFKMEDVVRDERMWVSNEQMRLG